MDPKSSKHKDNNSGTVPLQSTPCSLVKNDLFLGSLA